MQLKGLDLVVEDIVQSTHRVCVIGQRCPFSSSVGESTYRLIERSITGKRVVIWSRKKREEGLAGEVCLLVACPVTRET